MIVDEADIVTYTTDASGRQVQNINFDQFAYYEVVKCNRQIIGVSASAQGGVSDYAEWGCGDAADINADVASSGLRCTSTAPPRRASPSSRIRSGS